MNDKEKEKKRTKKETKVINDFIPNPDQEIAIKMGKDFLKNDLRDFLIKGRGGTGKTTVVKAILQRKKANTDIYYIPSGVLGVTVAHTARINLMKSIPNSTTYAAATDMILQYDYNGDIKFIPQKRASIFSNLIGYKIIVIDECSQWTQEMMNNLYNQADPGSKFIWMGNHHQLPPIGGIPGHDSPTFDIEYSCELIQKMRQDDESHIAKLGDLICEHIDGDHCIEWLRDIKTQYDDATGKGYAITTKAKAIHSFVKQYQSGSEVYITGYRNSTINEINHVVRRLLWGDSYLERFVTGEKIIMDDQYSKNKIVYAHNGQVFTVKSVYMDVVEFIECYVLEIEDENKMSFVLPVPSEIGERKYQTKLARLRDKCSRTGYWSEYTEFKKLYAHVSYAYCVTNYKIQGMTIKGCYVSLSDILSVKPIIDRVKLQAFYVGASRPTDFLAIF